MTWLEALTEARAGKTIRRAAWHSDRAIRLLTLSNSAQDHAARIQKPHLYEVSPEGIGEVFQPSAEDGAGTDWEVA